MAQSPIRIAIAGVSHGHINDLLPLLPKHPGLATLVGIIEPNKTLANWFQQTHNLSASLFNTDSNLTRALTDLKPDAVLIYTRISLHKPIILAAAELGIHAMVEKPLTTNLSDALEIRDAVRNAGTHVLTNYDTSWMRSHGAALDLVRNNSLGQVRKIIARDGHAGPKAIGVGPEWLEWLIDPVSAGGGAMFDFGCYGADLVIVAMGGRVPDSVYATAPLGKPRSEYPGVDDDASVVLQYDGDGGGMQAVLLPSWRWPFYVKDLAVFGDGGQVKTLGTDRVSVRMRDDESEREVDAMELEKGRDGQLQYLAGVLRGELKDEGDLGGLDTNVVVMRILETARESAATGKVVRLEKAAGEL